VFVVALLAGGVYLYLELRHHGGSRVRERQRGGERLPLFGTDLLVDRGAGARPRSVVPPMSPPPRAASPNGASNGSANGSAIGSTNGAAVRTAPDPREPQRPLVRDFAPPPAAAVQTAASAPYRAAPIAPERAPEPTPTPAFATAGAATLVATPAVRPGNGAPLAPGDGAMHDGETVRFSIPDEGTLQFLPGRLEIVSGPDRGRDVRFVRTGGEQHPEVTFGRSEGPAYRHVQLMARTVSRQHAAMSLIDGHWQLKNMSATNPVLLNGRSLEAGEVAPLLVEGDRIEMGEIVFLFHDR
jgi:hypothetical protein